MKMVISNMTLVKISSVLGVATVTMGLLLKRQIETNVKATVYYKDALKSLRSHKGAIQQLGEPIKDCSIDVGNESKNYTKETTARYEVRVKGPKQKGILYFWAERDEDEKKWIVNRIELELLKTPDKRMVIKSSDSN